MTDLGTKCPDCICGYGDLTCEECMGEGRVYPDEYDVDDWNAP